MKAVLDTKSECAYGNEIASRYHFPPRYMAIMSKSVDDWVVFRRPLMVSRERCFGCGFALDMALWVIVMKAGSGG